MSAAATSQRLITASALKRQRAWTETLIERLLSVPDAHGPNPHGWRAPMRYFSEDRMLEAERDPAFTRRLAGLTEHQRWRREQPYRTFAAAEVAHLEWVDDPWRIRLFESVRQDRRAFRRRWPRRPEPTPLPAGLRFEVLTLF